MQASSLRVIPSIVHLWSTEPDVICQAITGFTFWPLQWSLASAYLGSLIVFDLGFVFVDAWTLFQ